MSPPAAGDPRLLPPGLLRRYQPIGLLGSGTFGRVVGATDRQLGRQVAIKILEAPDDDPVWRQRFEREAQVTASLRHPAIVTVFDSGISPEGTCFIVYERIQGTDLAARIRSGPIPVETVAEWGAVLADALAVAHRAGIIHRDVKPANILIREGRSPVLVDFGIARVESLAGATTRQGILLGTPVYMAPELWEGAAPGPASDQFALAAVLVECLQGKPIRDEDRPHRLLEAIRRDDPYRLPGPDLVPAAFLGLLARALSRKPSDRFPDLPALGRALSSLPSSPGDPLGKSGTVTQVLPSGGSVRATGPAPIGLGVPTEAMPMSAGQGLANVRPAAGSGEPRPRRGPPPVPLLLAAGALALAVWLTSSRSPTPVPAPVVPATEGPAVPSEPESRATRIRSLAATLQVLHDQATGGGPIGPRSAWDLAHLEAMAVVLPSDAAMDGWGALAAAFEDWLSWHSPRPGGRSGGGTDSSDPLRLLTPEARTLVAEAGLDALGHFALDLRNSVDEVRASYGITAVFKDDVSYRGSASGLDRSRLQLRAEEWLDQLRQQAAPLLDRLDLWRGPWSEELRALHLLLRFALRAEAGSEAVFQVATQVLATLGPGPANERLTQAMLDALALGAVYNSPPCVPTGEALGTMVRRALGDEPGWPVPSHPQLATLSLEVLVYSGRCAGMAGDAPSAWQAKLVSRLGARRAEASQASFEVLSRIARLVESSWYRGVIQRHPRGKEFGRALSALLPKAPGRDSP